MLEPKWLRKSVFRHFFWILEELNNFRCQNQFPQEIWLQHDSTFFSVDFLRLQQLLLSGVRVSCPPHASLQHLFLTDAPMDTFSSSFCAKLRTVVYPSNMASFCLKLWENAFQTIPNISFFHAENLKNIEFLQNFDQPFAPKGWLRSASNFGKTFFRRFPTFHFSTPTKKSTKFSLEKFP